MSKQFAAKSIIAFLVADSSSLGGPRTPCTIRLHLRLWSSMSIVLSVRVVATFSMCVANAGSVVCVISCCMSAEYCTGCTAFSSSVTLSVRETSCANCCSTRRSVRRTGQHPFGGADRVLPEWIQWSGVGGGGGGSSRNFPGSIILWGGGGGVVAEFFSGSHILWGGEFGPLTPVTDPQFLFFSPLTAVTDPIFVFFKHILCFARIMSTLCPNSCRQTARIGGGAAAPPCPPVPYAYVWDPTHLRLRSLSLLG